MKTKARLTALIIAMLCTVAWAVFANHEPAPSPILAEISEHNQKLIGTSPEFLKAGRRSFYLLDQAANGHPISRLDVSSAMADTKAVSKSVRESIATSTLEIMRLYIERGDGSRASIEKLLCYRKAAADVFGEYPNPNDFDRDRDSCK